MADELNVDETVDSTPTVENKMMASFRIDRDDWQRFGLLAKRERLTVTQLLTEYIEKCLDADRSMYGVRIGNDEILSTGQYISTSNDEILKLIDSKINTAISTLSLPTIEPSISTSNDEILSLIDLKVSTNNDEILKQVESQVSIAISTLSGQDQQSIEMALDPLTEEIAAMKNTISRLEAELSALGKSLANDLSKRSASPTTIATPKTEPNILTGSPQTNQVDDEPSSIHSDGGAIDPPAPGKQNKPRATAGKIPDDFLAGLARQKKDKTLTNQQAADAIKAAGYGDFDPSTASKKLKPFLETLEV